MKYKNIDFADLGRAMRRNGFQGKLPYDPVELEDRFDWVAAMGQHLCPEYHFKRPRMIWWQNPLFLKFLQAFPGHTVDFNNDRKWNLSQLMRLCAHVGGDTAECGSFRGASSWFILESWRDDFEAGRRRHHIFDSFEGLSEPGDMDGSHWTKHSMSASEQELLTNLESFPSCFQIHKGWIPERFPDVQGQSFAFVHIDVDIYQPTRDSIEFFYSHLNDGGILVCDDYGFKTCPGATLAVDEFLADKPEKMLLLAAGGGWFMKGTPTAPLKNPD